jgi:hypothetical protein
MPTKHLNKINSTRRGEIMATTDSPAYTCTLAEFVEAGTSDDMTYRNFSILDKKNGIEIIDHCIVDDYLTELKTISVKVTGITDMERVHYRYSPDLLAYDVYGSTQLDFIILAVNGIATPTEFTMRGDLYLPRNSVLKDFLSSVYNAESEYMSANRAEYEA